MAVLVISCGQYLVGSTKPLARAFLVLLALCSFTFFISGVANVRAAVYKKETKPISIADVLAPLLESRPGGQRKYLVNGQLLDGIYSQSEFSPHEIAKHLEFEWLKADSSAKFDSTSKVTQSGISTSLRHLMLKNGTKSRPGIDLGENWAMFSNLNTFKFYGPNAHKLLANRYMVFASRASEEEKSDVWLYLISPEVKLFDLFRPIEVNENLPVYSGSSLQWSAIEDAQFGETELYIFSGGGGLEVQKDFFIASYEQKGYFLDAVNGLSENSIQLGFKSDFVLVDIVLTQSKNGGTIRNVTQIKKRPK